MFSRPIDGTCGVYALLPTFHLLGILFAGTDSKIVTQPCSSRIEPWTPYCHAGHQSNVLPQDIKK